MYYEEDFSFAPEYIEPAPVEEAPGFLDSFFSRAGTRLADSLAPSSSVPSSAQVGSTLADAIYQYGRGQVDYARERLVQGFLMTSEGQKLQAEGTRQTLNQYGPFILAGVVVLLIIGMALRK